jgi:hypothetical protein
MEIPQTNAKHLLELWSEDLSDSFSPKVELLVTTSWQFHRSSGGGVWKGVCPVLPCGKDVRVLFCHSDCHFADPEHEINRRESSVDGRWLGRGVSHCHLSSSSPEQK